MRKKHVFVKKRDFRDFSQFFAPHLTEYGNEELWILKQFAREQMISEIQIKLIDDKTDNKTVISEMIKETRSLGYYDNPTLNNLNEQTVYQELQHLFDSYKKMRFSLKKQGNYMYGESMTKYIFKNNDILKVPDGFLVNDIFDKKASTKFLSAWNGALITNPNKTTSPYHINLSLIFIILSIFALSIFAVYYTEAYQ